MQKCLDKVAKWYKVLTDRTHILIHEGDCLDIEDNIYAELDGQVINFNTILLSESVWNFENLPESELPVIADLLNKTDIKGLILIHNKYKLSDITFCCDNTGLIENFQYLINGTL